MTEAEWLACEGPEVMLELLQGRASKRKLRLFAVSSFRRALQDFRSEGWEGAVEVGERYADRLGDASEIPRSDPGGFLWDAPMAVRMLRLLTGKDPYSAAITALAWATGQKRTFIGPVCYSHPQELPAQAALLHDVFGNPFCVRAVDSAWLGWRDGAAVKLAQVIYEERAFEQLPVLADALEDAGCADADLLGHLRGPGPHVRGCWALDLVLGKS